MGLRFFRRVRLAPGLTLNLSKSGGSLSFGGRGARLTVGGRRGSRATVGLPGTGLYYTTAVGSPRHGRRRAPPPPSPEQRLTLGFFERLLTPPEERHFVDGLRAVVRGDETAALGQFRQARGLPDSAFLAGMLELKREHYAAAAEYLRAAADSGRLGALCAKYGIDAAVSLPITDEISARLAPERTGALLALVEAYQRLDRRQAAVDCLLELREAAPDDIVVQLSLAELLMDTDENDPDYCRAVVQMTARIENESPLHAALMLYKGKALRGLGMHRAARDVLTAALRRKKERPPALLHALRYERGRVYQALGQRGRARTEFERLYAEAPAYRDVEDRLFHDSDAETRDRD